MTDLAGRAELRAAADELEQAAANRHMDDLPCDDVCRAAARLADAVEPLIAAVEADRDRLQGELAVMTRWNAENVSAAEFLDEHLERAFAERDEARAQLAEIRSLCDSHWLNPLSSALWPDASGRTLVVTVSDVLDVLAASRPSPDTTEATSRDHPAWGPRCIACDHHEVSHRPYGLTCGVASFGVSCRCTEFLRPPSSPDITKAADAAASGTREDGEQE